MILSLTGCSGFKIYQSPVKDNVSDNSASPLDSKPKAESVKVGEAALDPAADVESVAGIDETGGDQSGQTYSYVDYKGNRGEGVIEEGTRLFPYDKGKFVKDQDKMIFNAEGYITRFGIDVSKFQGDIDWNKVKDSGVSFAFIRVGFRGYGDEGTINKDEKFEKNIKEASEAGIDIGVYIHSQAISKEEAEEEADYVLNLIKDKNVNYPIVLDEEHIDDDAARTDDITKEQATEVAVAFCERIKKAGYTPAIYADPRWQADCLKMSEVEQYQIWYADYEKDPQTPYDFRFWQYSNEGRVDGISTDVDLNCEIINVDEEADRILSLMSTDDKIAQIFCVTPESIAGESAVTEMTDALSDAIQKYPVGGVIMFDKNIKSPDQTKALNKALSSAKGPKISPFIAVDEEGGKVARVANNNSMGVTKVDNMSIIGITKDDKKAYSVGSTIGAYLKDLCFDVDFAPDADVITNTKNEVVKDRSFGEDPEVVSTLAYSYANGLKDKGIVSCYKHFPGHGGTLADSHNGMASTDRTYVEMEMYELVPFASAADNDIPLIMSGHINTPNAVKENIPASVNKEWITDVLRNKFQYNGVIITDAFNMGAITKKYSSSEAAKAAFLAGNDMILMPSSFTEAYDGIKEAVKDRSITEERLNESVKRILVMKLKYGI